MPSLEPNLLYQTAQQLNPRRAGTPGRAPRNWRAVVYYRRPLRLFSRFLFVLSLLFVPSLHAQSGQPQTISVQLRVGAFAATNLVTDAVSSRALDDSIPGLRSNEITLRQKPGPLASLAVRVPLRGYTQLEASASAGRSMVRGNDGREEWDVAPVTVGNFVVGVGYLYRRTVMFRAGVGLTRLFAEERALFSKGNSLKPVLEGGLSGGRDVMGRRIELDLRAQTHSYGTATLRDNGGSDGNVARVVLQIGTTLWQAGQ